jgi:hypothetical protein
MTQRKSFKSRVRQRMEKTGERYTTARHHLLNKSKDVDRSGSEATSRTPIASERRISDDALRDRTGRGWEEWFTVLDDWGAVAKPHPEISRWLVEEHQIDGWWAQTVTVGYEQARGLRVPGQGSDGKFTANASKTVNVPVERLFEAFADESLRSAWLRDVEINVRTSTPPKTFRADWEDGTTRLAVWFTSKGADKSQVAVQHEKLTDGDAVAEKKAYWRDRLNELKKVLEA